jgi:hypothetical protein
MFREPTLAEEKARSKWLEMEAELREALQVIAGLRAAAAPFLAWFELFEQEMKDWSDLEMVAVHRGPGVNRAVVTMGDYRRLREAVKNV